MFLRKEKNNQNQFQKEQIKQNIYNITGSLGTSFPSVKFVTFPSGPLDSAAQLLAQSHIYTLPTHTHSLTRCLYLLVSLFLLLTHTHSRLQEQHLICEEKHTFAYTQHFIKD